MIYKHQFKRIKIMNKLLFITSLFLVLSACGQKLPSYEEGYGMVATPYHLKNRTSLKFMYTYEWISSEDENFSVKIQQGTYPKDLALSELLPSGNYMIDTIVIRTVSQSKVISTTKEVERKIEPPFELYISPGSIMMVPVVYEFEQYLEKDSIIIQPNVHNIEDIEEEIITIIATSTSMNENYKLITSIKGIGPVIGTDLIIKTGNFKYNRQCR